MSNSSLGAFLFLIGLATLLILLLSWVWDNFGGVGLLIAIAIICMITGVAIATYDFE